MYTVDLAAAQLPCLHTRLAYAPLMGKQTLLAQIRIALAGSDPEFDLTNGFVPAAEVVEVMAPIPAELRGEIIDIYLVTLKDSAPEASPWTLLWERPIVYQAL